MGEFISKFSTVIAVISFLVCVISIIALVKALTDKSKKVVYYTKRRNITRSSVSRGRLAVNIIFIVLSLCLFLSSISDKNNNNGGSLNTDKNSVSSSGEKIHDVEYIIKEDYNEGNCRGCSNVCQIGDWIYYAGENSKLHALAVDGSKTVELQSPINCNNLTEYGQKLYFVAYDGLYVHNPEKNKTNIIIKDKLLTDSGISSENLTKNSAYCIFDDMIYYVKYKQNNRGVTSEIWKTPIENINPVLIYTEKDSKIKYLYCDNERLYFQSNNEEKASRSGVYSIKTDGSDKRCDTELADIKSFVKNGDFLYINSYNYTSKDKKIFSRKIGEDKENEIYSAEDDNFVYYMYIFNDIMYFSDTGGIYAYDIKNKYNAALLEGSWKIIGVSGNWIYYCNSVSCRSIYRMRLDGSYTMQIQ